MAKKSLFFGIAALAASMFITACNTGGPTSHADLQGKVAYAVTANAGTSASWVGDVDLKSTTGYTASRNFTVAYNNRPPVTVTLESKIYTGADEILAVINAAIDPIGLVAKWSASNLQLDAKDKTGSGKITVGGPNVGMILSKTPRTDTAGIAEDLETYTITITGAKALSNSIARVMIDGKMGAIGVSFNMTSAELAAAIAAKINDSKDSGPNTLYSALNGEYITTSSGNVVTIKAKTSSTNHAYKSLAVVFAKRRSAA
jgi:hypothetical protein